MLKILNAALILSLGVTAAAQTTTTVSATPNPVTSGQSTTISTTVTETGVTPTGEVDFYIDSTQVSSAELTNGAASYSQSTSGLTVGPHSLYAYYTGSYSSPPSTSPTITLTVSAATKGSTTTTLTAPSTVTRGHQATLSAAVTGASPTGTVSFYISGSNLIGTAPLSNGTASITGTATGIPDGTYPVTATYNGNANNSPSTSAAQNVTISGTTTTSLAINPSTITIGNSATLTATINTDSSSAPTGTVTFTTGGITIGHATVTNGVASYTASSAGQPAGTYTVTAAYSGDANNVASSGTAKATLTNSPTAFTISPAGAAIATGGTAQFAITPSPGTPISWSVDGIAGGNATVGTISSTGLYTAPSYVKSGSVTISAAESANPKGTSNTPTVYVVVPGSVSNSNNSQVASYSINAPVGGEFSVQFGQTTSSVRTTWQQPTTGASQQMLVAGMAAPATYYMVGTVAFPGGITYTDSVKTFATTPATTTNPSPTITLPGGATPSPGVEFVNLIDGLAMGYDLNGTNNYALQIPADSTQTAEFWNPINLQPNGHWLGIVSGLPHGVVAASGATSIVYELLLDGTVVRELTLAQLQANLAASGYLDGTGNVPTLVQIHHDIIVNPDTGHWIMLTNTDRTFASVEGETGTQTALGDIVIDVDPNNNFAVSWVWNEFDHLDINRHPFGWPDWTHSNALVYSPSDKQLLVSSRHQSWVMKVNYLDGAGDGTLIWHFGYQGDFTLENGTDPTDWAYMQHGPSFTSPSTSGVFGLTLMDNGDDRVFPNGETCANAGVTPCPYSRVPLFTIDENAMTARLDEVMPNAFYSYFGGNAEVIGNGDEHADFAGAAQSSTLTSALVEEWTPGTPTLVWSMSLANTFNAYRSKRLTSYYPGVTWY